jgi:hypothetical protein
MPFDRPFDRDLKQTPAEALREVHRAGAGVQRSGRATWEWAEIDKKPAVRRRRAGDHDILRKP